MDCTICKENIPDQYGTDSVYIDQHPTTIQDMDRQPGVKDKKAHIRCVDRPEQLSDHEKIKYLQWHLEQEKQERADLEKRMLKRFATIHAAFSTQRPQNMHDRYAKALYDEDHE